MVFFVSCPGTTDINRLIVKSGTAKKLCNVFVTKYCKYNTVSL